MVEKILFLFKIFLKVVDKVALFIKEQVAKYKKFRRIKRIEEKYNVELKSKEKPGEAFNKENKPGKPTKTKKHMVRKPSSLPEEGSLFADFDEDLISRTKYQPPPLSYLDAPTEKSKSAFFVKRNF